MEFDSFRSSTRPPTGPDHGSRNKSGKNGPNDPAKSGGDGPAEANLDEGKQMQPQVRPNSTDQIFRSRTGQWLAGARSGARGARGSGLRASSGSDPCGSSFHERMEPREMKREEEERVGEERRFFFIFIFS